jgi:hypothetical protein
MLLIIFVFHNIHEPPSQIGLCQQRICQGLFCTLTVHYHVLSGHRLVQEQHSNDISGVLSTC